MPSVIKINHVAIAVPEIDGALTFWQAALGLKVERIAEVPSQKTEVAFMDSGGTEIELVKPTAPDSGLGKFVAERGGGIHHLCFEVDDIEGMLAQLKAGGIRLINDTPQTSDSLPGRKFAFVHPKATGGVLVELYEIEKKNG